MVLFELGSQITGALSKMSNKTVIDQDAVNQLLKEIGNALIQADVDVGLVLKLRGNMQRKLDLEKMAGALNKRKIIREAVIEELVQLVDSGKQPWQPKRKRSNVIMFVGLQGSGKTTTVVKLAAHYKRQGWKAALVCADTFRAGAYDQLKQMAIRSQIPFYGSYSEVDPVEVAREGVEQFKADGFEVIIVDTSGRHKQEEALFEEMVQVRQAVQPDNIIFVMDGSIGQAAKAQAEAFKSSVPVGSVVITKMDGHAKGGGALSAVAATQSPIVFVGTGEHVHDLDPFDPREFIHRMLGMGNIRKLTETIQQAVPEDSQQQKEMMERISGGMFTLRDMYDQYTNILKMGPLGKVMEMMPGMQNLAKQAQDSGVDSTQKVRNYMVIMDSMTDQELDDPDVMSSKTTRDSRIRRLACGSGRPAREVHELLIQYQHFREMMQKMKGLGMMGGKGGQMSARQMSQLSNMVPPQMRGAMSGGGIQSLLKQMGM